MIGLIDPKDLSPSPITVLSSASIKSARRCIVNLYLRLTPTNFSTYDLMK